ncbi:MAG: hypothetical protein CSA55_03780 [Ilumatobacter coccineus]|uniref:Uncharacterized protein n=1 Tax=Ilumatobacter coccineus TaxID=467094 RepID=A0A2G6KAB1_9ACTN|nr:MAG: hypothetical protein CSA55_03780 [Ilumatobacter coccineus]
MASTGPDKTKLGVISSALTAIALITTSRRITPAEPIPTTTEPEFTSVDKPEQGPKKILWAIDQFQRSHRALGFPIAVLRKFGQDRAGYLAALVAYFGFFSIFPLMMAFTSGLGFIVTDPDKQQRFAEVAADQIPVVGTTIKQSAGQIEGSGITLVLGIAVALWSGLKIIDAMQNAMNSVWDVPPFQRPNMAKKRARSLAMLFVIGGGLAISIAASSVANVLDFLPGGGRFTLWGVSLAFSIVLYLVSFQLLTDMKLTWKHLIPGAVVGGIAWWALQTFGTPLIARQQANAGETYGSFGAIIALLFFLFIAAQLSILAAEVGVVKARKLWPRSIYPKAFTEADLEVFRTEARGTRLSDQYDIRIVPARSRRKPTPPEDTSSD